jgi:polyisoprenoid-binding protein YceI
MKAIALAIAASAAWFAAAPVAPPRPAGPQDWSVFGVHSSVQFKIRHADAVSFYGGFKDISGTVTLDDKAENCKIAIKIAADSIDSYNEKRDAHLKGPDFFDSKQFPDITFTSTKVKKAGDGMEVDGELSLHGVKKSLSVKVAKTGEGNFMGGKVLGYETSFTIKRSDFGMKYGLAEKSLGDEVVMTVALELNQPKK